MRWLMVRLFIIMSTCVTLPSTSSGFKDGSNSNSLLNWPSSPARNGRGLPLVGSGIRGPRLLLILGVLLCLTLGCRGQGIDYRPASGQSDGHEQSKPAPHSSLDRTSEFYHS